MSVKASSKAKLSNVELELCQIAFDHLLENGNWPNSRHLQVSFRKNGDLWDVANGIDWQILRPGEKFQVGSEVKLSVEGISLCKGAEDILSLFVRATKFFITVYIGNPETPKATSETLAEFLGCDVRKYAIVGLLLSEEPRLLSGHNRLPDGKWTDFKLSPDILRFENIETIDDYLRILHKEREPINEINADLQDVLHSFSSMPTGDFSQALLSAITDIVDNEKLREIILQDIEEIQIAFSSRLWKSVRLLCGSACEGILLSVLGLVEPNRKKDGKQKHDDYRLSKLIEEGVTIGILNERDAKLAHYIRDSRNIIHPHKAMKEGVVDYSSAYASYVLLWIVSRLLVTN